MAKNVEVTNEWDQVITVKTEFYTRKYYAVHETVYRRFKLLFGACLQEVFQEHSERIPLNTDLKPNEIERMSIVLKFDTGKYVELCPSDYLSIRALK